MDRKTFPTRKRADRKNTQPSHGFTLVEIIVVLLILSVIGAITVPRVVALETFATQKCFEWAISELNGRESLAWSKMKTSDANWIGDEQLFAQINTFLGAEYTWSSKTAAGGTLRFKGQQIQILRTPSTYLKSGSWKKK